jgi:hypothetical protein
MVCSVAGQVVSALSTKKQDRRGPPTYAYPCPSIRACSLPLLRPFNHIEERTTDLAPEVNRENDKDGADRPMKRLRAEREIESPESTVVLHQEEMVTLTPDNINERYVETGDHQLVVTTHSSPSEASSTRADPSVLGTSFSASASPQEEYQQNSPGAPAASACAPLGASQVLLDVMNANWLVHRGDIERRARERATSSTHNDTDDIDKIVALSALDTLASAYAFHQEGCEQGSAVAPAYAPLGTSQTLLDVMDTNWSIRQDEIERRARERSASSTPSETDEVPIASDCQESSATEGSSAFGDDEASIGDDYIVPSSDSDDDESLATPSPAEDDKVKVKDEGRFLNWHEGDNDKKMVKGEDGLDEDEVFVKEEDEFYGEDAIVKEERLSDTPNLDNTSTRAPTSGVSVRQESIPPPDLGEGRVDCKHLTTPTSSSSTDGRVFESNDSMQLAAHAVHVARDDDTCIC